MVHIKKKKKKKKLKKVGHYLEWPKGEIKASEMNL